MLKENKNNEINQLKQSLEQALIDKPFSTVFKATFAYHLANMIFGLITLSVIGGLIFLVLKSLGS